MYTVIAVSADGRDYSAAVSDAKQPHVTHAFTCSVNFTTTAKVKFTGLTQTLGQL